MADLELVDTKELVEELKKRFPNCIIALFKNEQPPDGENWGHITGNGQFPGKYYMADKISEFIRERITEPGIACGELEEVEDDGR